MSRANQSDQPARQPSYRRMYTEVRRLKDRIQTQEGCITWLLVELRAVQKRVDKLEQHNASTIANRVRAAYESVEEVRDLEQRGDLPVQDAGDQAVGHLNPVDGS